MEGWKGEEREDKVFVSSVVKEVKIKEGELKGKKGKLQAYGKGKIG